MRAAILAGGLGRRLGEAATPKPLVPIAGKPILWHITKCLAVQGVDQVVYATGHYAERIDEEVNAWKIPEVDRVVVDTGIGTATGERLARLRDCLANERFLLAWCDGLSDVSLAELSAFHESHGKIATIVGVHPPNLFGSLYLEGDEVVEFREKEPLHDRWMSAGIFLLEPAIFEFLTEEGLSWEWDVLPKLASAGELMVFRHEGYWKCMDTLKQRDELEEDWKTGRASWCLWKD